MENESTDEGEYIMNTQTITRQGIHAEIDTLSDAAIEKLAPYVAFLSYEDKPRVPIAKTDDWIDPIDAGTPNAETFEALKEVEAGDLISFGTKEELFKYLDS